MMGKQTDLSSCADVLAMQCLKYLPSRPTVNMAANLLLASLFKSNCSEHKVQATITTQNLSFEKTVD